MFFKNTNSPLSIRGMLSLTSLVIFLSSSLLFAGFDDYLDDIKTHSVIKKFPWGVRHALEESYEEDVTPLYGRALDLKHGEFNRIKATLITEWETAHGISWPTYTADLHFTSVDETGRKVKQRIRKAGDRYDAHHIIPQSHNGPNTYWNLVPLTVGNHIKFHKPQSALGKDCCSLFKRSCGLRLKKRV